MKCTIPSTNVKIFGRAVHSLARIGEDIYIEQELHGLSVCSVSTSRSAYASYLFGANFFSHFSVENTSDSSSTSSNLVLCKIPAKGLLNAFRTINSIEKSVEKCKLCMNVDDEKFVIQMLCKFGLVKTFNLSVTGCENVQAVYDKEKCPYSVTSQSRLLSDAMHNFQLNHDEGTLTVSPQKAFIKNYTDDEPDPAKAVHTELTLSSGEFDSYNVHSECSVTFCLKELRALLFFTEAVNLPINMYFSQPGNPMIFYVDNQPLFEVHFVLATLASQTECQAINHTATATSKNTLPTDNLRSAHETTNRSHIDTSSANICEETSIISNNNKDYESNDRLNRSMSLKVRPPSIRLAGESPNHRKRFQEFDDKHLDDHEDEVPGTPPTKLSKFLFKRCFEATFDPANVTGHDKILANDSDDDT